MELVGGTITGPGVLSSARELEIKTTKRDQLHTISSSIESAESFARFSGVPKP